VQTKLASSDEHSDRADCIQLTLHAIKATKHRMYIGISESKTRRILEEELAATGLQGGEGLILFGGESSSSRIKLAKRL
jgi:hypothetical protein